MVRPWAKAVEGCFVDADVAWGKSDRGVLGLESSSSSSSREHFRLPSPLRWHLDLDSAWTSQRVRPIKRFKKSKSSYYSPHTKKKAQHCTFKRKTLPCKAFAYIYLKEKQQRTEKNEKPSKKISKVKGTGDFEETKDTREDTRYLTRSLCRALNGTANQLPSFLLIFVVVARGPSKLLPWEAS